MSPPEHRPEEDTGELVDRGVIRIHLLVEQLAVDPVVLGELRIVGRGPGRVHLLANGHDVARLVTAREAGAHATLREMVEHGEVLGQQQGIARRQHVAHLADAQAGSLHGGPGAEHDWVVRNLEPFEVEVVLREGDEVEAKIISIDRKSRVISLSIKSKDVEDEKDAMKELRTKQESESTGPTTIGDLIRAQMENQN